MKRTQRVQRMQRFGTYSTSPPKSSTGLKRFGAAPEEALVVEDSPRGLTSAVAAGIDCVIVHNDFTASPDLSGASHRIETLRELKDIVLGVT